MFTLQRSVPAFLIAVGLLTAPACAAQRPYYGAQRDYRDFERRAYDDGYRRGLENGQRDARDRRDFRVDRDRIYRDVDGPRGRDRDGYVRFFRDGYRDGYTEAYNRNARNDRRIYPNRQRERFRQALHPSKGGDHCNVEGWANRFERVGRTD